MMSLASCDLTSSPFLMCSAMKKCIETPHATLELMSSACREAVSGYDLRVSTAKLSDAFSKSVSEA